ncbi:MAG: PorV/PorQ family protein [Elusimicrobia bacterium]|nr:PorV/PorQ family protein [Elusimicrobiota bacterium]
MKNLKSAALMDKLKESGFIPRLTGAAILLFLTVPVFCGAAFNSDAKGTSGAQFLKLGAGARAVGMGEAYCAVANDASGIYWNPAGLARIEYFSFTMTHASLFGKMNNEFAAFARSFRNIGTFGMSVQYLSAGTIPQTDSSGFETGQDMKPADTAVSLAYAFDVNGVKAGIAGKYIHSRLTRTASTLTGDFGALSPALLNRKLRLAFIAQNVGGSLKFDRESDALPLNIKLGSSFSVTRKFLAAFDVNFPRDNKPYAGLGAEYITFFGDDLKLAGRLGFNSRTLGGISGLTGLSAGVGIIFRRAALDYAFLPFGALGCTHRISITIGGGKQEKALQQR